MRQEGRGTYNDSLDQPTKTVSKQQARLKERLDWLQKLVEDDYRRHPMNACSDPVDAIRHQMIKKGMKQKDLVSMLGGKSRVSEVLARHRQLKLPMIQKLNQQLDIPAKLLIRKIKRLRTAPTGTSPQESNISGV